VAVQLIPTGDFSSNSHRMLDLRDAVLRLWADQVRAQVARAESVSEPVLIDTMPVLYERLCAMLTPAYFGRDGIDVSAIGAEHGVERASLTDYDAETVLAEFQVFRSVLFDMLGAHAVAPSSWPPIRCANASPARSRTTCASRSRTSPWAPN
jgi:hypothetical protein